ncbi:HlyD family type I secretion periplasmic adaptor subunit [Litoreibacter roseus]|uniref:Membrane fusion protein (MFP) family protein n=1 Tax=Litoreibacter roseus TaxID=2601869 RepID=A0A6N6JBW2_9RHOB|nr:HlyD family type I secretion periplasmic adaptor subunit [Litoreibacter roseus]GFE63783.1 HlyD family type I secretion periplasmic adaptor subunit [Litoreibacter roseus]
MGLGFLFQWRRNGRAAGDPRRAQSERRAPSTARLTIRTLLVTAGLGFFWASTTNLPEIAYAQGSIQPTGALRRVEHLDGGVVERIYIREGQEIHQGQRMVHLTEEDVQAEFESLRVRENVLNSAVVRSRLILNAIGFDPAQKSGRISGGARATAQLKNYDGKRARLQERIDAASARIETAQAILDNLDITQTIAAREMARVRSLVASGLQSETVMDQFALRAQDIRNDFLRARASLVEAETNRADAASALTEHYLETRNELLSDLEASEEELALIQRAIVDNRLRRERLVVPTPISGIVQTLYITSANEVLEPGGLVAEVLPTTERLIAELRLKPSDIGHVDIGDPVEIRLTTFNTKRFGILNGEVSQISATSSENDQYETFFTVRVDLQGQVIGEGAKTRPLKAGMEVDASIVTGSRTVLEYVVEPVLGPFRRAFRER